MSPSPDLPFLLNLHRGRKSTGNLKASTFTINPKNQFPENVSLKQEQCLQKSGRHDTWEPSL